MKRVYTLYRVSTTRQVDVVKDDIPMQRIACHDFADRFPDWEIIQEFEEKGISGYKVSAEKRDAIFGMNIPFFRGMFASRIQPNASIPMRITPSVPHLCTENQR